MTIIKTNTGTYSLQSFQLTINNKTNQITLTISSHNKERIKLQAPLTDVTKAEFLKQFFALLSAYAEKDATHIDLNEPLNLARKIGFIKGFTLSTKASTYANTLKTTKTTPTEGIMLRQDTGESNNAILTRQYIHLASNKFTVSAELKPSTTGATAYFYINGNEALLPYLAVDLSQALKTNQSIRQYAKKLEQTLINQSQQQHYIDLLQAVNTTPPTFRSLMDYTIGILKT